MSRRIKARYTRLVNFMADPQDHACWAAYAKERKITMGEFIRNAANAAMGEDRPDVPSSGPNYKTGSRKRKPVAREHLELDALLAEIAGEAPVAVATVPPPIVEGECLNRLPSGTFCFKCGKIHK